MDTQDIYNLQEAYMSIYQDVDYLTEDTHLSSNMYNEEVNYYNIILSYLIDEGYAESPESAVGIMVNMSEDWKQSIVEGQSSRPTGYLHPLFRGEKQKRGKKPLDEPRKGRYYMMQHEKRQAQREKDSNEQRRRDRGAMSRGTWDRD